MAGNQDSITQQLLQSLQFKKSFTFRTPVPVELCAQRLGDLPYNDGKQKYTIELEPVGNDYQFKLWVGNRHQREPQKARCIGGGWITQQGNETVVQGEVQFGLNRSLMLMIISIICGLWTFGMFSVTYWWLYLIYTGGILIFAPLYLYWQTFKERNAMIDDIQAQITPFLSDRRGRLSERETSGNRDAYYDAGQQSRRRRQ